MTSRKKSIETVNHLYWLSQIQHSEQLLVGNKLFALSQLLQHGCPILPGFVLDNELLRKFLQNLDDSASLVGNLPDSSLHLDVDNYRVLQSVAQCSRQIIAEAAFPEEWQEPIFQAAQQLNSPTLILTPMLTIPYYQHRGSQGLWRSQTCFLTPEALTAAIKRVWGELFTAKSLIYWQKLGLTIDKINLAVLIQPLKQATASGIVEISSERICVQSTWGLVQSLLWGEVKPDEYELDRQTGAILKQQLGHKNFAYHPKNLAESEQLDDCLESYSLSEAKSEQYSLEPDAIAQLIQSIEAVLNHQQQIKYLRWILLPPEEQISVKPQFYFTQLNYQNSVSVKPRQDSSLSPSFLTKPLLTGLGAAPGSIFAPIVVIANLDLHGHQLPQDRILVTKAIAPHQMAFLKQVRGVITEEGGMTSHAAILARELGIPAVVNATDATKILSTETTVYLDGTTGRIEAESNRQPSSIINSFSPMSNYPISTQLMVNLSQPITIERAVSLPVDGVGLLRSELMLLELLNSESKAVWRQKSKQEQFRSTLIHLLSQFTSAFAPRPIFYRSLDCWDGVTANNRFLGDRGTYSYLLDHTLFDLELEAIAAVRAAGNPNLNLILPFVRSVAEFEFCRRRVVDMGLTSQASFQLWIMAEVPSAIFLLPQYVKAGVQGIAIGTNDLTQLMLGVDREQQDFRQLGLDSNHPVMQQAIAQLIQSAKAQNIPCSICGQAPVEHPSLIHKSIEWGVTSISVPPEAVETTYRAIARAEQGFLLKSAIKGNER